MLRPRQIAQRLGSFPILRTPVSRLWNTYEHLKLVYHVRKNTKRTSWRADIDPYRLYWISPENVVSPTEVSFDFIKDTGKVLGGSWDTGFESVKDGMYYKSFRQHFVYDQEWNQTPIYQHFMENIQKETSNRYTSRDEFLNKLDLFEKIYDDFKNGRYKLQKEVAKKSENIPPGHGGQALCPRFTDKSLIRHEISLNIGRHGRLIRNDGRHRLALALVAGLEKIPCRIVVRHRKWQSLRDEVAKVRDEMAGSDVPDVDKRSHIERSLENKLNNIKQGINHPDIRAIMEEEDNVEW